MGLVVLVSLAVLMRRAVALEVEVTAAEVVSASRVWLVVVWLLPRLQVRRQAGVPGSGWLGLLLVETELARLVAVEVESASEEPDQLEGSVLVLVLVDRVHSEVLLMSNSVKVTMGVAVEYS